MIYQICFKPLKLPPTETKYRVNEIYLFPCSPPGPVFLHHMYFRNPGDYIVEYWFVSDRGDNSEPRQAVFSVNEFRKPAPIIGCQYYGDFFYDSNEIIMEKDCFQFIFKRHNCGMGKDFDWSTLDLSGIRAGYASENTHECFIDIRPSSWISKQLNNNKRLFNVIINGGKSIKTQGIVLTEGDGKLKTNLPNFCRDLVAGSKIANGKLSFLICKTGMYIFEI